MIFNEFIRRTKAAHQIEMKKILIPIFTFILASVPALANTQQPLQSTNPTTETAGPLHLPKTGYENTLEMRSEFSSHTSRDNSDTGNRKTDWNYIYITDYSMTEPGKTKTYTAHVDIPDYWAGRIIIMHNEGGRNSHVVRVNDILVGSSRDSGVPSEFDITKYLCKGTNTIKLEIPADTAEPESGLTTVRPDITSWFLYSQPRTRIVDYTVWSKLRESGDGELYVDVVVANDFLTEEKFNVGFDVFTPAGRLAEYGIKEMTMTGNTRDTVHFKAVIYGAGKTLWSAEKPETYRLTLFIGDDGRILEYVPVNAIFGKTEYADGAVYRNGKKITVKHKTYNASTPDKLRSDIARFKKEGFNTLLPDFPQPYWFYDICDRAGMYVIDQVNINSAYERSNLRIGGTPSNDPAWLPEYMQRTQAAYNRTRNHPCVIAWSLGGDSGNGYNLYKSYLWFKENDPSRAVIYRGANGDWNNDLELR